MVRYRAFIRKYKLLLGILSFVFIGIPEYVDTLWSLYQKIKNMENVGLNVTWLYAITTPIGLGLLLFIIWQSRIPLENNEIAWEVYDNLVNLLRGLMNTHKESERALIHNDI